MRENQTFLLGHQNGHPAWCLQGHVTSRKLIPLPRHVTNLRGCELAIAVVFLWFLSLRYFVFSALDFVDFKRYHDGIYQNLSELSLFILYVNEHNFASPWLYEQYVLIAFVDSCRDNKLSSSGRILFWIGGKVIRRQDPLQWAWTKERQITKNTVCCNHQGKYLNQVQRLCWG